jgi:hypothetical protein
MVLIRQLGDQVFFDDPRTKVMISGRVVDIQPVMGAGANGEDICMLEVDYGGHWAGYVLPAPARIGYLPCSKLMSMLENVLRACVRHTHLIQATEVTTKTELANRDRKKRMPRAPAPRYSDYMTGSTAALGCSKAGLDKQSGRKTEAESSSYQGPSSAGKSPVSGPPTKLLHVVLRRW